MKKQISRLSPHQNGKVFGFLMALSSLIFVIPMAVAFSFMPPGIDAQGNQMHQPSGLFLLFIPVIYLLLGYVMTAISCMFYNFMFKYIGGIEYETVDQDE